MQAVEVALGCLYGGEKVGGVRIKPFPTVWCKYSFSFFYNFVRAGAHREATIPKDRRYLLEVVYKKRDHG